MMKTQKLIAMLAYAGIVSLFMQSCDSRTYDDCPDSRIFGDWGVINDSKTFGEYDSLYFLINPIGNLNDSVYFNGDYTDSYYHSDPVRATLRYSAHDSIFFNLERQYATEINPMNIIMTVEDTVKLKLRRDENNGNLYRTGPDSLFKEMLRSGRVLKITATNTSSASEAMGSQDFSFTLNSAGFDKALALADSLNVVEAKAMKAARKATGDSLGVHNKSRHHSSSEHSRHMHSEKHHDSHKKSKKD